MTLKVEQPVALACIFLWMGFVCAISFMETWLKFRAPGVTLSIGLSIGRIVFNVLNKIEWVFAFAILCSLALNKLLLNWQNGWFFAVLVLLFIQTFWLLPMLDKRAVAVINGEYLKPSKAHFYFIAGETLKLAGLLMTALSFFKQP